MNQTLVTILQRRSVRRFTKEQVPQPDLDAILQAGCAAPYGGCEPPVRLIVVRNATVRERLAQAEKEGVDRQWSHKPDEEKYWNLFFAEAPALVATLFRPTSVGGFDASSEERIGLCSAACAVENMLLAATSLGLGACFVGPMPEAKTAFETTLGVAPPWEFIGFVAVGYSAELPREKKPADRRNMVQFLD